MNPNSSNKKKQNKVKKIELHVDKCNKTSIYSLDRICARIM